MWLQTSFECNDLMLSFSHSSRRRRIFRLKFTAGDCNGKFVFIRYRETRRGCECGVGCDSAYCRHHVPDPHRHHQHLYYTTAAWGTQGRGTTSQQNKSRRKWVVPYPSFILDKCIWKKLFLCTMAWGLQKRFSHFEIILWKCFYKV